MSPVLTDRGARDPLPNRAGASVNVVGLDATPRRLITAVLGLELHELEENAVCCGFGGSALTMPPEVAAVILARTLKHGRRTAARCWQPAIRAA
ncbi:MAG TPA: heterodisulfide reductase-related iron-sulfur binding cluster [Chloroflexia bacterium]|nr:heterodisulfide reductase-related iron-sulfur binding cluster [Chloroflexia bacterium]